MLRPNSRPKWWAKTKGKIYSSFLSGKGLGLSGVETGDVTVEETVEITGVDSVDNTWMSLIVYVVFDNRSFCSVYTNRIYKFILYIINNYITQ